MQQNECRLVLASQSDKDRLELLTKEWDFWSIDRLLPVLKQEAYRGYFLCQGDEWHGFLLAFQGPYSVDVVYLYILKDARKRGLGQVLLKLFIAALARQKEMEGVFLEVAETNTDAINLYFTCGFKQFGKRKDYYGPGKHALNLGLSFREKGF